ncbi:uncharacterized protein MONBRDRAFT_8497 [Monosiga brevicollis MX1]|uniref:CR-type domain-containing protein n=1 Tax=Monosiga brevicollis TaxID=81824 RepID=A9V077_MONBE|nr:uncharacterized protein MONBRDRAFT_8497 [Monosiga brevicollis MX1]EDQ89109.1 predicted protein [Monosiga brevicollis MX1]|eukprot:XP_001746214.1 hypothetical protein [Monosiga brevicollis MX1]
MRTRACTGQTSRPQHRCRRCDGHGIVERNFGLAADTCPACDGTRWVTERYGYTQHGHRYRTHDCPLSAQPPMCMHCAYQLLAASVNADSARVQARHPHFLGLAVPRVWPAMALPTRAIVSTLASTAKAKALLLAGSLAARAQPATEPSS